MKHTITPKCDSIMSNKNCDQQHIISSFSIKIIRTIKERYIHHQFCNQFRGIWDLKRKVIPHVIYTKKTNSTSYFVLLVDIYLSIITNYRMHWLTWMNLKALLYQQNINPANMFATATNMHERLFSFFFIGCLWDYCSINSTQLTTFAQWFRPSMI